jgi:HlyD family secretion protein
MDNLSNELNKLKIDKSKRAERREGVPKGTLAVIALLILIGGVFGWELYTRANEAVVVDTVRPRVESTSDSAVLVATGYVIAHHKIQVGSKIAGRVAWIGVEKGDRVSANQIIVRLEDREYRAQHAQAFASYNTAQARLAELERGSRPEEVERANADVQRAEAQLRTDQASYERVQRLAREGVASSQSLDEAKGRYETSVANLASIMRSGQLVQQGPRQEQIDAARSEVARAKAATDYAATILEATEIRVPSSGTILERNVEQGEMVTTSFVGDRGAKSFVVTLADLDDIQVELDINQNDFNRITATQTCNVVTDAYPDRVYKCRVDEIAPEANRQKATVQVKVKFLEPDEFVRPEMNARVTFLASEPPDQSQTGKLYVLPKRAIVDRDATKAVYVVSNETVQVKPITVAKEVGNDVYVSAGISGAEAIIVGDQLAQLKAGDKVQMR